MLMPKKNSSSNRRAIVVSASVLLLAGLGLTVIRNASSNMATQLPTVSVDSVDVAGVRGMEIGQPDAPITIMEFADFECPACGHFSTFIAPLVKERLVQTGKARFVVYDFPLSSHRNSVLASRAARCAADQDQYWTYSDLLYGTQSQWAGKGGADKHFVVLSERAGLDVETFKGCLRSDAHAEEIARNRALGEKLNVAATPTLIINGSVLKGVSQYKDIEKTIERITPPAAQ